jgi:hypothetical protein
MITFKEHISEMADAALNKLSLHAVAKEVRFVREDYAEVVFTLSRYSSQNIPCTVSSGEIKEGLKKQASYGL